MTARSSLFAVRRRGGRRGPQRRDVVGQDTDRGQLGDRQPGRAGPLVPVVLLAQVRPLGQRGLPLALKLAGHQPVLRLGELILAPRPVTGEIRAFQPLPPDPAGLGPAGLGLPGGGDLAGLLAPRDRNKTLTALAGAQPVTGAQHPAVQRLQFFLSESRWDAGQVNARRLELLRADPATAPHGGGVLVIDDSGDRKDG
jgi:hypothetical protein